MSKHAAGRLLVAVSTLMLTMTGARAASPAPPDPFARVPPFPTACYTENDPFVAKIEAAFNAAQAELTRQQETNRGIEEAYRNIDPMEKANRMQQWMMSNPQEAMDYMQATQAVGDQTQAQGPELNAAQMAFDNERMALPKRYKDALAQAQADTTKRAAPIFAKMETLGFIEGCRGPDWARAEFHAIVKDRDTEYRNFCATWWSPTGAVQDYLKRYRTWITTKYLPSWQKTDAVMLRQYAIMNTPAASWRSTAPLQKMVDYIDAARSLFSLREAKPLWSESCASP